MGAAAFAVSIVALMVNLAAVCTPLLVACPTGPFVNW